MKYCYWMKYVSGLITSDMEREERRREGGKGQGDVARRNRLRAEGEESKKGEAHNGK